MSEIKEYYDTIADRYDQDRFGNSYGHFIDYEERRALDVLIDRSAVEQRLEIACGTGRLTGYATHALDESNEMMKHARAKYPDVRFYLASAVDTGCEDESFDCVYAFHLMMHLDISVIKDILAEAYRILKPGGRLIFDFPSGKRRRLLHHKPSTWHGGTGLTSDEVTRMAAPEFRLERSFGIMMLPIHKIPVRMRNSLRKIDYSLANGWLKEYSSYLIVELVKQ